MHALTFVMPGLAPGIHVLLSRTPKDVDGRDKPGHDGGENEGAATSMAANSVRGE
jgi:hypothetical protein